MADLRQSDPMSSPPVPILPQVHPSVALGATGTTCGQSLEDAKEGFVLLQHLANFELILTTRCHGAETGG